jgi:catechol 2,3-dioxygenase-like lactoylglutathione lyase family enzyme
MGYDRRMNRPPLRQQVTFLYTRDLAGTTVFYEEILALPLVLDQWSCRIYRVCGDAFLGFCQRDSAPEQPQGIIFTFVTPAVDAWYDYLVARGQQPEERPLLNPTYNVYHFFLRDPNGYLLEFQEFRDPAWPG